MSVVVTTTAPLARLRLFGGASLEGDEGPVAGRSAQRRRLALLALLAGARRPISRDKVIAYLWEDADAERARKLLSESLYVIRKAFGEDAITGAADELQLNRTVVWSDVWEFSSAIERGDDAAAVALYAGPFLDGFFISDAAEFEKWVDGERDAYARTRAEALVRLAAKAESAGDLRAAAAHWRTLAEQDPYNATYALGLMRALDGLGDRAGALQHARVHAALIRSEFDADPDPQIQAFAQQLKDAPQGALTPPPRAAARPSAAAPAAAPSPTPQPALVEPGTATAVSKARGLSRSVLLWSTAAVIIVTFVALWKMPAPAPGTSNHSAIVVLPFAIHGSADELHEGMVELLSTDLDGAGDLRAIDPHAVLSVVADEKSIQPRRAMAVARRFGAKYYVLGDVTQGGRQLQIDAWLYDAAGETIARASTRGVADSLLLLVDRLATQLLSARGLARSELAQLAAYTTRSYPALKNYLQGESAYRAARYNAATSFFLAAIREDPKFALADYRLSAASEWNFDFLLARRSAQRALNGSERLAEPYQRMVSAWWHFLNGDAALAQRQYEAVLINYPDNIEARSGLGEVLVHFNPMRGLSESAARDAFDRVLAIAPAYGEVRYHALEFAARDRNMARFDSLLAGLDADNPQYLPWHAVRAFEWGDAPAQQRVFQQIRNEDELTIGLGAARLAQTSNLAGAELIARELIRPNRTTEWRAGGHLLLAEIMLSDGNWPGAQAQIADAARIEPDWPMELGALFLLHPGVQPTHADLVRMRDELLAWHPSDHSPSISFFLAVHATVHNQLRLYLLGLTEVRLGDLARAESYRRDLEHSSGDQAAQKLAVALSASLAGHIELARGNKEKALEHLAGVTIAAAPEFVALSPFYSRAHDRFVMGDINRDLGRYDEAKRWYTSLLSGYDFAYAHAARLRLNNLNAPVAAN